MLALLICLSTVSPSAPQATAAKLSIDSALGDPEIDALSRTLRMQVYETFRSEREEYNTRRRAATQVVQGWMRSGQQESARGVVLNWLQEAIVASRPGSAGSLPAIPAFAKHVNEVELSLDMAVRPVPDEVVEHRSQPDHRPLEHDATDPSVSIRRVTPSDVGDEPSENRSRIFGSLGRAVYRAVSPPSASPPSVLSPSATVDESESSPAIVPSADVTLSAADDDQDSEGDDVQSEDESHAGEDDESEIEVEIEVDPASSTSASSEPQVNLPDLEARVQGYNLALQALEDALREEGVWTANRLMPIIDELAELADRRRVVDLYGDLLPDETSHLVDGLSSADFAMQLAEQRIEDARASIRSGETSSDPQQRQEQLQQLDAFARQLAEFATDR